MSFVNFFTAYSYLRDPEILEIFRRVVYVRLSLSASRWRRLASYLRRRFCHEGVIALDRRHLKRFVGFFFLWLFCNHYSRKPTAWLFTYEFNSSILTFLTCEVLSRLRRPLLFSLLFSLLFFFFTHDTSVLREDVDQNALCYICSNIYLPAFLF